VDVRHKLGIAASVILILGGSLLAVGSSVASGGGLSPTLAAYVRELVEVPAMNIPRALREWNWGGGSCVHASTVMCLRWQGEEEAAAKHRAKYSGGETSSGLRAKLDRDGIDYSCTHNGSEEFLDFCSRTRRGAVIFYYPSHSICFAGFAKDSAGTDSAVLLDNNRIEKFIWVEKQAFLRAWRGYGGFALTPLFRPAPPVPYNPYEVPNEECLSRSDTDNFHPAHDQLWMRMSAARR
jgi:hypothetical protein